LAESPPRSSSCRLSWPIKPPEPIALAVDIRQRHFASSQNDSILVEIEGNWDWVAVRTLISSRRLDEEWLEKGLSSLFCRVPELLRGNSQ
jgi:hypothetical protein